MTNHSTVVLIFQELKAQYEVHNNIKNQGDHFFEQALRLVPVADEMLQRQLHGELLDKWDILTMKINSMKSIIQDSISSDQVPATEKLDLLERELHEIQSTLDSIHGVIKTEEEMELYVERLSVLFERVCVIQVIKPITKLN